MAGLTPTGYTIKRLPEILADLRAKAVELFQDLVPEGDVVNTGDNSTLGRMIGIISPSLSDAWEASQEVYDAFNINAATGVALDNLCALGGVARQPASGTVTAVKLTGSVGTVIPLGSQLTSSNNGKFHSTLELVVLNSQAVVGMTVNVLTVANATAYTLTYTKNPDTNGDGPTTITYTSDADATEAEILAGLAALINSAPHNTVLSASVVGLNLNISTLSYLNKVDVSVSANLNVPKVSKTTTVVCDETGPVEQPINTITRIAVPILGWDSATNPASGILGRDLETDAELRARYQIAKFGDGSNLIESLYSALYALDGVESVAIIENDTDSPIVVPAPVPAHSFYLVILGGESVEIARAIWNNKPAGILSYGTSETVEVLDSQGIGHNVSFDRPVSTDIYVSVNITVQSNFAADGVEQMKQAIANHINALLIGEDVLYSRLYQPINSVAGHYVNSLTIGTAPSPVGTSNIAISFNQKATVTTDNIVIVTS